MELFSLSHQLWVASLLNAVLVAHQLYTVVSQGTAKGLSLVMMTGFLYMQVIYSIQGWNTSNMAMFIGMGLSAIFNIAIITYVWRLKRARTQFDADPQPHEM